MMSLATVQSGAQLPLTADPSLFALLVERVQDYAIFLLDPNGRVMSWNAGAANIKQYTAQDIIGKHFSIFYTAADLAADKPGNELRVAAQTDRKSVV